MALPYERLNQALDSCRELIARHAQLHSWSKPTATGQSGSVTNLDLAIEDLLIDTIRDVDPTATIVSEETLPDTSVLDGDTCYVIDPIDNTDDLIAGRTGYAISLAILRRGQVVAAFLDFPARSQRFSCSEHSKTVLNGELVRLRGVATLEVARVAVSTSQHRMPQLQSFWQRVHVQELVPIRGFTSKLAAILTGECDAAVSLPVSPLTTYIWDYAAAALLLARAGGILTVWDGTDPLLALPHQYQDGWTAASTELHRQLQAVVNRPFLS
jgi:myo-inositol-1(or 4)-monophosphatase